MRALTILSALILAVAAGAYGALVLSGGGTSVGEPYVVVPVKPQPLRSPDAKSPATASDGSSGAPSPATSMPNTPPLPPPAPAPRTGASSGATGAASAGSPSVAGVAMPAAEPVPRPAASPAPISFPGLSIDPATVSGPRMAPGGAPGRGNPAANPAGLAARPGG